MTWLEKVYDWIFEGMTSVVSIIVGFLLLALVSFLAGSWYWGGCWLTILASLGIWEGISYLKTGKTLTQHYRKAIKENQAWAKIFALLWFLFCGILLGHLVL